VAPLEAYHLRVGLVETAAVPLEGETSNGTAGAVPLPSTVTRPELDVAGMVLFVPSRRSIDTTCIESVPKFRAVNVIEKSSPEPLVVDVPRIAWSTCTLLGELDGWVPTYVKLRKLPRKVPLVALAA